MHQVLFTIRLSSIAAGLPDLPIYGYGTMLFLTFLATRWLAIRLARREGYRHEIIDNLALCLFIFGILGARLTFYIQYRENFSNLGQFFAIWDGGLVFYGSVFGGIVGYIVAYILFLRKNNVSTWKMIDILAPCIAVGLAVGRLGCLLNGCCYGNVACTDCPAIHFPLASAPREVMTARGYQTAAGFTVQSQARAPVVDKVEPGSAADGVVKPGDKILVVDLKEPTQVDDIDRLNVAFGAMWPRGQNQLEMTVERDGAKKELVAIEPRGIGLHPTQVYESISMGLMAFLLLSYYPFRRRDGMVLVICMLGYGVHRFLNEMLRTDTDPVAFGLTLSQNISLLILSVAVLLWIVIQLRPANVEPPPAAV